jgi:hypothetical protein
MNYQNPHEARFYIDKIITDSIQNYKNENEELKERIKELEFKMNELQKENFILNEQIYYMPGNEGYYECEKRFKELSLEK